MELIPKCHSCEKDIYPLYAKVDKDQYKPVDRWHCLWCGWSCEGEDLRRHIL